MGYQGVREEQTVSCGTEGRFRRQGKECHVIRKLISECSTCHLYIPPTCPVPEPTDPELDMLGYALGYKDDESRLGCQITVSEEMVGWCQEGGVFGLPRY
jgi:ferredoxin